MLDSVRGSAFFRSLPLRVSEGVGRRENGRDETEEGSGRVGEDGEHDTLAEVTAG